MKTVRDACAPHPKALSIRLSDQIEKLDALIDAEDDGAAFFERTHITEGIRDLISEGVTRLAGASSQAVFHLKQAMGGGKTHLLVGFGLVAKHPHLRRRHFADVSHRDAFEDAAVAAFNGRNTPIHFFWGEIAKQLKKSEAFREFWTSGPKAPDEEDWLKLLEGERPVLILLDEMPPYFHYLATQSVGRGTVADIATRAFANLLTAAGKKSNVCVVVSDLAAAYETGGGLVNQALKDARSELGRQERTITPVDLAANEIYDILRKQLFTKMPDAAEIADIASAYGQKLEEAAKAKTAHRGAEAIADEVAATYPFHPRLKNVVALFKENEHFKQTRGVIELVSRLLRSVWERTDNDVFLIGPQHFDLSIAEVREKITEISGMRDVIATDLWDGQFSSHAQVIDLDSGKDTAAQVGTLLLTASLSTAHNAVKGLTAEEVVECLVTPLREPSEFLAALEKLDDLAWYLHRRDENRLYFDTQENLTKLLQNLANDAPENQIEELIRHRLSAMFKPTRRTVYQEVLPLPQLEKLAAQVRKGRVLAIVSPDAKIPPEEIRRFFEDLSQKNNLCVLTGDKTQMASVESAARQLYATQKADARIPQGHAQRGELEDKQATYEQSFIATVSGLFDKVLFPIQRRGKEAELAQKPLNMTRDTTKPFDGEEQIEKTLVSDPLKLYVEVEAEFDAIRDKSEDLLWLENQDETPWAEAAARYAEQAGMPWLPPRGLDDLKAIACNQGLWEDIGNGYISKRPKKKRTAAQIVEESGPDDTGRVRLRVNTMHAGPAPRIHYAENGPVDDSSARLTENPFTTKALQVAFLVIDRSDQYETGEPEVWKNRLVLRNKLHEDGDRRRVELFVAPEGEIRYTLDASEPRDGKLYTGPIAIDDDDVLVRAFASAGDLETKAEFNFAAKGDDGIQIDDIRPAWLVSRSGHKLDSRTSTFEGLKEAKDKGVSFEKVTLTIGQGAQIASVTIGEVQVDAAFLTQLLESVLEKFSPDTPITMTFRKAHFQSGHDLKHFCEALGLEIAQGDVEQ